MHFKPVTACLIATSCLSALAFAPARAEDTAITIYSSAQPGAIDPDAYRPVNGQTGYAGASVPGYAIVRQERDVNLPKEESVTRFSDVAALIDPTTVQFKSLTDPKGTKVAEQDYQFDLVSQQKLLDKYIDKTITVEQQQGDKVATVEGTLLSTQGGLTLKSADGRISALSGYSAVHFPELPGGLITRPTLVWDIITDRPGDQKAEVSYETRGITWWADYNLVYRDGKDEGSGKADFSSWVSIVNQTGTGYKDARLKLIAGDVARAAPVFVREKAYAQNELSIAAGAMPAPAPSFAEKSFFEYHLYTLSRPVTLPDNSTKQLELIPAVTEVPVEKEFVYNGFDVPYYGGVYTDQNYGASEGNKKVDVFLKFRNTKENGLGVPLPAGRMRVNQRDEDGALEFIGENVIDHTPQGEELQVRLGNAFDIVGERRQVSYSWDAMHRTATEEIEVKLRNHKKKAVKVKVLESLYRATGWDILTSSEDYKKDNAHRISFLAEVEPEEEKTVRYTVRYHW